MVRFRRLVMAVAPVAAVVMLAGCATPSGVDKNLIDEWSMLAAPKVPLPPVGSCYDSTVPYFETDTLTIFSFKAAESCTTAHISETFYVGELSGTAASVTSPPKGADLKDAWAKCNTEAQTFLGGDYHDGRLELIVLPPSSAQWSGGGRYFRCDLAEVQSDAGKPVSRTSSLKGALTGDKPIALTCAQETYEADGKTWRTTSRPRARRPTTWNTSARTSPASGPSRRPPTSAAPPCAPAARPSAPSSSA